MSSPARHLVIEVEWPPGENGPVREMFGPWGVTDDDSHLADINRFVRELTIRAGPPPSSVKMWACVSPADWQAGETHPRKSPQAAAEAP
jgi:hypothetical protein